MSGRYAVSWRLFRTLPTTLYKPSNRFLFFSARVAHRRSTGLEPVLYQCASCFYFRISTIEFSGLILPKAILPVPRMDRIRSSTGESLRSHQGPGRDNSGHSGLHF